MKNDPSKVHLPPYPFIFSKTLSSLIPKGQGLILPKHSPPNTINYEVELGVMLKKGGFGVRKEAWRDAIGGYFLLLDYTDGAAVKEAVEKGAPWFLGKA